MNHYLYRDGLNNWLKDKGYSEATIKSVLYDLGLL